MKADLIKNTNRTFSKLAEVIASFSEAEMNADKMDGNWTAGQVSEHLIKSISGLPKLCSGNTEKTVREPDEKVDRIKNMFLDFSVKMKTQEFLQPSEKYHNKEAILLAFRKIKDSILNVADTHDLTLVCLDFEVPAFGKFTKYEWIWFCLFHTQRHIHQLEKLKADELNQSK